MAHLIKDIVITDEHSKLLLLNKHAQFISSYGVEKDEYEYCMTEYLRMSGLYWGVASLALINKLENLNKKEVIDFVKECQCPETGGFSASKRHDPHLLYTLSAIQVLTIYDALNEVDLDGVVKFVTSLQQNDGSFTGDKWGEVDVRFSFCAVACLSLINRQTEINLGSAIKFVISCMNFDGGFGSRPGSESHAGLIYCCVGFLSITHQLHHIDGDLLGWWLCERQLESGGLNGRPEKLPDVCYSWWVVASLTMLGRQHWINARKLRTFVLACQDTETGGYSDRPGDVPDPFHTLFGLAALSLLGEQNILPVNPTYCMPESSLRNLSSKPQKLTIDL